MKSSKDISVKKLDFSKVSKEYTLGKNEFKIDESNKKDLEDKIKVVDNKVDELFVYLKNFETKLPLSEGNKQIEVNSENESHLKKINDDMLALKELMADQNNKIKELSDSVDKNINLHKIKAEQANLIKEGVENSFANLINLKNQEVPEFSELKRSHLELDNISKSNQLEINNIYSNINKVVEKSIDKYLNDDKFIDAIDNKIKQNNSELKKYISNSTNLVKKEFSEKISNVYLTIDNKIKNFDTKISTKEKQEQLVANKIIEEANKIKIEKENEISKALAAEKIAKQKEAARKAREEKEASAKEATKRAEEKKILEQKAAAEKAATKEKAAREKAAREKAAREKAAKEKAAKEKEIREKAAKEKLAKEKAAKAAEEKAAKEKAAKEIAAREKAAKEKVAKEIASKKINLNDKKYKKYIDILNNSNLVVYPNSGFTLYLFVETNNVPLDDNAELIVFIDGEIRGKTAEFIKSNNSLFVSINVNLKKDDEEIDELVIINSNHFYSGEKNYNLEKFKIGDNNLDNYPDLPKIFFLPR